VEYELGEQADALRVRLRALLAEILPENWTGPFSDDPVVQEQVARICHRLADEQLLTINWPAEYGGGGAGEWEQTVVREEMWAHFEPRGAQYMGLNWVGPTIMHFGTDAQRDSHLPRIAAGRVVWCQGFSEPESGTDLGSLKLAASRDDAGGWRVNGQKIWTSYATIADWCFLAARTSRPSDDNRQGITIFLVPMDRAGITVRPIESIMGHLHLNEVFFDDVQVQPADVLGVVDRGWDVIKFVLGHERIGIARYARDDRILADLGRLPATERGASGVEYVRALVKTRIARLLNYRAVAQREAGRLEDAVASVGRLASIQLDQEVAELALNTTGADSIAPTADPSTLGQVEDIYRYARSATIASGTIEVQRMIVARATMGRPAS
jgi:alkylation response protein AidB-like acyl-CoA dehydrogenase